MFKFMRVTMSVLHFVRKLSFQTMSFMVIIVISLISQIEAEQEQCYAETTSTYPTYAWMTSYLSSRGPQIYVPKNCSDIYIWAVIRHGTRYPVSGKYISTLAKSMSKMRDEIIANHKKGRGSLCKQDLDNLQNWSSHLTEDMALELTPQGKKEMIFLAQKMKQAFPNVLESPLKDIFVFQTSDTNRTRDSAVAFTNELLGTDFNTIRGNNITENDEFLRLYEHCPNYAKQVKLTDLFNETKTFKSSALWQKITAEISLRLGFLQPIPYDTIRSMYNTCGYEKAWYNSKPPFCAVFTPEDLKVMEYLLDLTQYHTKGYANPHPNENLGCPLVRDMMLSLSEAAKNSGQNERGKFLFSHSEAVVPMMVKLGLNKDNEPLKLENYYKMVEERKWRSALFDSFASNIIAALYKCPRQNGSQVVVTFHLNERPVEVPQCESNPCTLEELQNIFQDVFEENQCDNDFCQIPQSSKSYSVFFSSNVALIFIGIIFILVN